jgi:type II secretory pathway pseudopilin PulG
MLVQGSTRRGVGMTEVLIAVGIIVILVAVLIPTVGRARQAARVVQCTNNLQQISTSFRAWGAKQEMRYPGAQAWYGVVKSTANTSDILFCPDGPTAEELPEPQDMPILDYHPKNNHGHETTKQVIDDNHFILKTVYQKQKPEYALFDVVRVMGDIWKLVPTRMDARRPYGGPPIDVYASPMGTPHMDVQVGQTYLVLMDSSVGSSTYGFNSQMGGVQSPKTGRILATDYDTPIIYFDANGLPTKSLPARHYKTKLNVLYTDFSVSLTDAKELKAASKPYLPKM